MASTNSKMNEANEHLRNAAKCMKTSFFKWKSDLDGAVLEYTKAAVSFKNAQAYHQAKESYVKAAEIYKTMKSCYEQAGLLSKEEKDYQSAVELMDLAAYMYRENGTPDSAAMCLSRAAKLVDQVDVGQAIWLYRKASDIGECEDRPHLTGECIGKAARLLIADSRFEEGIECLKKEISAYSLVEGHAHIRNVIISIVLVYLHQEDYVAANNFFTNSLGYPEFSDSEEATIVQQLLDAYNEADDELVCTVLSRPLFKYLDNVFAKLARDIKVPLSVGSSGRGKSTSKAAQSQEDADEYPDGLC